MKPEPDPPRGAGGFRSRKNRLSASGSCSNSSNSCIRSELFWPGPLTSATTFTTAGEEFSTISVKSGGDAVAIWLTDRQKEKKIALINIENSEKTLITAPGNSGDYSAGSTRVTRSLLLSSTLSNEGSVVPSFPLASSQCRNKKPTVKPRKNATAT